MKAMILKSFGGPESFELSDVPKPVPGAGQVLVRVHATSINPLDYQVRRGDYPDYVPLPAITGHDVSGVVEEVGPGVTSFAPGDEVWYTPQIFDGPGSYAEYHVAAESIIGHKPPSLSHLEAASLTLVGGTVWEALIGRAALRVGESILIHGGAGGVGGGSIGGIGASSVSHPPPPIGATASSATAPRRWWHMSHLRTMPRRSLYFGTS